MSPVSGKCGPPFEHVRELLQQFIQTGEEVGASIAVNLDGEDIVDLWGGWADKDHSTPWKEDTIVPVFSSSKCVVSLAVLKLVDRGLLSVTDKVSKYWPEFAAGGKQDIEIRHLLSHASGLSGWDKTLTLLDVCNLDFSTAALAEQGPWWKPGTASGYHAFTFGHLLGPVVRSISGKSLKRFIAEDVAVPLHADIHIGAEEKDWGRIAPAIGPEGDVLPLPDPDSIGGRTLLNPVIPGPDLIDFTSTPAWRQAEIGGANGHGNARAMNRLFMPLQGNGDFLSSETVELIFQEQVSGVDLVIGSPIRWGLGFALKTEGDLLDWVPAGKVCYLGGMGGSIIIVDRDRKLTITYAMNKMASNGPLGNECVKAYVKAIYAALG